MPFAPCKILGAGLAAQWWSLFSARFREVIAQCGIESVSEAVSPLIANNGAAGLDTRSAANIEKAQIAKKKGKQPNRGRRDATPLRRARTGERIDHSV